MALIGKQRAGIAEPSKAERAGQFGAAALRLPTQQVALHPPDECGEHDPEDHQHDHRYHHAGGFGTGLGLDDQPADAAHLLRNRVDRGPLRGVLALMPENHADRAGADLRRIRGRSLRHGSILSRVAASSKPGTVQAPPLQPAAQEPIQPAPNKLSQADAELLVTLVRTTLVAVHQANLTGNYTVLRDLGAPGFRDKNSAADLAQIFAPIRQRKIDLGPVVFLDPQLSQAVRTNQGMLHLVGKLATRPVPVGFELLFQPVNGVWQLFGISIAPMQEQAMTTPPAAAPAASAGPSSPAAKRPAAASKPAQRPAAHPQQSAPSQ